jgi:hypothetical protein
MAEAVPWVSSAGGNGRVNEGMDALPAKLV